MIQNINITAQTDKAFERAFPLFLFERGEKFWFCDTRFNMLFSMSKAFGEPQPVGQFPCEEKALTGGFLFYQIASVANKLYFAPFSAQNIGVYSIDDGVFSSVPFKEDKESVASRSFQGAIAYGDSVYFTPLAYPSIMKLDTKTNAVTHYSDWLRPIKKRLGSGEKACFCLPLLTEHNTILIPSSNINAVVEFDLATDCAKIHWVGKKPYGYRGICFDGENYWLAPNKNNPILKWNPESGLIKEFVYETPFLGVDCFVFRWGVFCDGFVWFLPMRGYDAIKINVATDELTRAYAFEAKGERPDKERTENKYDYVRIWEQNILAYDREINGYVLYSPKNDTLKNEIVCYSPETVKALKNINKSAFVPDLTKIQSEPDCFYNEGRTTDLPTYLDFIAHEDEIYGAEALRHRRIEILQNTNANMDGTCGEKIYEYVKGLSLGR